MTCNIITGTLHNCIFQMDFKLVSNDEQRQGLKIACGHCRHHQCATMTTAVQYVSEYQPIKVDSDLEGFVTVIIWEYSPPQAVNHHKT